MSTLSGQACGNAEHLTSTNRHRHRHRHIQIQTRKQTQTDRQTNTNRHIRTQPDRQTDRRTHTHTYGHTQPVLKCSSSATATHLARGGAQTAARHPHRRTTVALNNSSAASRSSIGHGVRRLLRHSTSPGVSLLVVSVLLGLDLTCNLHSNVTKLVSRV